MDDNEDASEFSDDGFDNLADSTIKELEENAILSTQRTQLSRPLQHDANPAPRDAGYIQNRPSHAVALDISHEHFANTYLPHHLNPVDDDEDNYEWIGDNGVPTPVEEKKSFIPGQRMPGEMTQREQWRQQRFGQTYPHGTASFHQNQKVQDPHHISENRPASSVQYQNLGAVKEPMHAKFPAVVGSIQDQPRQDDALRARIEELLGERDELTTALHKAKLDVEAKQGEIAVIRASKNKDSKVFDRQIISLKRALQDEAEKHEANLQAITNDSKKVVSENRYLKYELTEESEKTKILQQKLKQKTALGKDDSLNATPKKVPANSLRDGFDDNEIMVISPSKSARRSKPSTPTAVGKRKRKADYQSPVRPLVLRQSSTAIDGDPKTSEPNTAKAEGLTPLVRKDLQAERNLKFVQEILKYKVKVTNKPLIEMLMDFAFPSQSARPFSTILLEDLAKLCSKRLQAELLQIFIEFWSRALKEKYYKCVPLLLEVVEHVIDLEMSVLDEGTLTILLPVLQDSVTINAAKRFKYSPVNQVAFGQFRQTPQSVLNHDIDGTACLNLLYKIACIVEDERPLIELFWRSIGTDFVLMMLNVWQPTVDITMMIRLLKTSIFPSSFGNICPEDQQARMETYIIERVSYLLWETPKVDEGLKPYTRADICKFRLEVMTLLTVVAIGSSQPPHDDAEHHGSKLIAHHQSAIARIVRSLYDEVNAMYLMTSSHELHAELVNRGVHLLYHILQVHGSNINMPEKLSAVNGGVHKHRVVLSRLAFSEGFFIDRLITNETVSMAINMLEESVTPDEADQLLEAFPHFKGRDMMGE